MRKGDFNQNMGRVFAVYVGGCLLCAAGLAVLSLAGVSDRLIGIAFIALTIAFYAVIGLLGRPVQIADYYVAGQQMPAIYAGMATAADWMSAASFLGLAGAIYAAGYDGLALLIGWTGGYVLLAVLLAPYLRKFGQFTVPDFLAARYGGRAARVVGVLVLTSASFAYVTAQLYGIGIIAARFLGLDFHTAVFVGLAGILLCSIKGGMRAVMWTQVAQYAVVIVAYLLPVTLLSVKLTGVPLPQVMYGLAMDRIAALSGQLGIAAESLAPSGLTDGLNVFGVAFCLMLGTASLPHVLARFFTTPSVREARIGVAWSLLFIALLYSAAPAYAAFAKLEILRQIAAHTLQADAPWLAQWGRVGLAALAGDGGPATFQQLHLDADALVLAAPEIAGLPFVVAALAAAGALAAAMSSADGLLLSIGKAVAHDIHHRLLARQSAPDRRQIIARLTMAAAAVLAAWVASCRPADIVTVVGWAFSLAASGLFSALVLGIWWKRATAAGALAGMLCGWGVCVAYIVATRWGAMPLLFGLRNMAAGLFGVPVAFLVTLAVSLITAPPGQDMQRFIDSIRTPRGKVQSPGG